ncbi:MAG TPA: helix-turn-helix transcriptional regulator [Bellilinea sp.]|nr:helix-turn-helix transcriptional regulator [Bellilinea sp.]
MAKAANVFRKATVELLLIQLSAIEKTAGVVVKSYRDYSSATNPSKTQAQLAAAAGTNQPTISALENGKKIPPDPLLTNILTNVGLPPAPATPGPLALAELLRYIRDQRENLKQLSKHFP